MLAFPRQKYAGSPQSLLPLIQGGGPAQLVGAEVRAPERRPARGDHGLRCALRGARQGRLRPRRGQEVPHPRLQRGDQVGLLRQFI